MASVSKVAADRFAIDIQRPAPPPQILLFEGEVVRVHLTEHGSAKPVTPPIDTTPPAAPAPLVLVAQTWQ